MCGRYSIYDIRELRERFELEAVPDIVKPLYNAAPLMVLPIITNDNPAKITMARWGLIPHWVKDEGDYKMINARAETIDQKPAYKGPFIAHRCLVPANGFFEWKKSESGKIPFYVQLKAKELFAFAGLWDIWTDSSGNNVISFSIITTHANDMIRPIHERMPVILPKASEKAWLERPDKSLLKPAREDMISANQVSTKVNSPLNNSPEILNPVRTLDSY